jgi:DNA-binding Lrp family transcriptional regulator
MDSLALDDLDRRLVHALAIDGRAPFSRIAAVLGRSDRTIAHRYRRLRTTGLRVVGQADGRRLGYADWLVRIRCAPDVASAVATALTRRDDTGWVAVAAGGTEITCVTRTRDGSDHLLLEKLTRTPRVDGVTAQCLLRGVAGLDGWSGRTSALSQEQVERLRDARNVLPSDEPVEFTDTDWALVRALALDGRTGHPALAAATGWSESTVRRRLAELHREGLLYFDVELDPAFLGYGCQAALWLTVVPSALTTVANALAGHSEIAYAAATTGATNVAAFAVCRDLDALYDYLAVKLGALEGVLQVDTSPVVRQVKRSGTVLAG